MEAAHCLKTSAYSPISTLDLAANTSEFVVSRCFYPTTAVHLPAIDPDLTPSDAPIAEAAARAGFDCSNWYVFRTTTAAGHFLGATLVPSELVSLRLFLASI